MRFKLLATIAKLAGIGATIALAVQPMAASADYNNTKSAWWNSPGYINVSKYFYETPPGGTPWYTEVRWASNAQTNFVSTWLSFSGESHAFWWGDNPWCATGIQLTDTFRVSGVAVSVSFPLSGGISGSGDRIDFTTSNAFCNAWTNQVQHNYSGIDFNAWDISTFSQNDCGVFTITWASSNRCTSGWDWVNF
jgi:hypothetical protein